MNWDWIIAVGIILGLILAVWARVSGQTIVELLGDIREFFSGVKEESEERLIVYD